MAEGHRGKSEGELNARDSVQLQRRFGKQNLFSYYLQNNLLGLFVSSSALAPSGPFSTGTLSPAVLAQEGAVPAQFGVLWVQGVCCKSWLP